MIIDNHREFPIEFSAAIGAIAAALAKAQGELEDAKKDATNPHFKNRYATLSSVRAAVTPAFSRNGLAVAQYFDPHGTDGVCIVTLLMHSSGEWIKSKLYLPVSKKDAQGFGSAISYGRRYALAAIANIASDDDDDAEAAARPTPTKPTAETKPTAAASGIDVDALVRGIEEAKDVDALAKAILAVGRVKDKLTAEQLKRASDARERRVRDLEAQGRAA